MLTSALEKSYKKQTALIAIRLKKLSTQKNSMTSWMDLNDIMLSGIIQRNPVWSHVWNLKKKKEKETNS